MKSSYEISPEKNTENRLEGVFLQAIKLCDQLNQSRSQLLEERSEIVCLIGDLLSQSKAICEYESKLKVSIDNYVDESLGLAIDEIRQAVKQESSKAIQEIKDNMNKLSDNISNLISRFEFENSKQKFTFYLFNFFISAFVSMVVLLVILYKF